jgi:uncharacterized integral membrane protein
MSASSQIPDQSQPAHKRRPKREQRRTVALVLVAIVITLFAVLNVKQVQVNWIVGSGGAPLIIVIVVSLLVGFALGHLATRRSSKRD